MTLYDELNSLDDLRQIILGEERESETLEYKTASRRMQPSERDEAAKDLSAFANSLGGLLIYGIATHPTDKTKPMALEPIDGSNVNDIIVGAPAKIRHPLSGLRWKTLPVGEAPQALLVDVAQSAQAPHQVISSQRYYRRQGAESVPMTHELVELYFGRRGRPLLEPRITSSLVVQPTFDVAATIRAEIALINTGARVARDVFTWLEVNPAINGIFVFDNWHYGGVYTAAVNVDDRAAYTYRHVERFYYPGLPQAFVTMTFGGITGPRVGPLFPLCYLDVYADEMQARRFVLYAGIKRIPQLRILWEDLGTPPAF